MFSASCVSPAGKASICRERLPSPASVETDPSGKAASSSCVSDIMLTSFSAARLFSGSKSPKQISKIADKRSLTCLLLSLFSILAFFSFFFPIV